MARINISIKDELKARMDKHPGFNWSEIASEAFNNQILKQETSMETKNMTDAISRLKASKELFNQGLKTIGYEEGHSWAMAEAEYEELKRLYEWNEIINNSRGHTPMSHDEFMSAVTNQGDYDLDVFDDGAPIESKEYIEGFLVGALAVFAEAKH